MQLYTYNSDGVYTGTKDARVSPARAKNDDGSVNWMIPAMCTDVPPPAAVTGMIPVWDESGIWRVVEDHRGALAYSVNTQQPLAISSIGPIPEGYTLLAPPGRLYTWDGQAWQPEMAAIRAEAEAVIDAQADVQLAPYISLSPGRAMTYMAKEAQARQYLAAAEPAPEDYPLITGEVGITADTARGVAEVIVSMSTAWHRMGALIESVRLAAKAAVRKADTPEGVQTVLAGLAWPSLE